MTCWGRFYGPAMTPISPLVVPLLERWLELTKFEFDEPGETNRTQRQYLFAMRTDPTRCYDSSAWSARVKAAFKRHSPRHTATPPSLLRSSFITALRDNSSDPELLKVRNPC